MSKKRVCYRGIDMVEGWPEQIRAAQEQTHYRVGGQDFARIRYGDEHDDWGANEHSCHDCRVIKGEFHVVGCDGEECPSCHGQAISCDCPYDEEE